MKPIGSRAEVYHNNAEKTPGGLRKKDLYKNKRGRIVSLKKSKTAKAWNPLKMLGLLSGVGDPFGAKTFHKGSISKTRKGKNGQLVEDFMTHTGTKIKRNGKKYKAYFSRKGSVRKTNKWKLGRDYSQSGGISGLNQPLGSSGYPGTIPDFSNGTDDAFTSNPQIRALGASGGRSRSRSRSRSQSGGISDLAMTSLDSAYPSQISNNFQPNTPLSRSLTAAA